MHLLHRLYGADAPARGTTDAVDESLEEAAENAVCDQRALGLRHQERLAVATTLLGQVRSHRAALALHRILKVKVKFSHTRYRALGPELIPVYRQSARR